MGLGHHSPASTLVHLVPDDLPRPGFPEVLAAPAMPRAGDEEGSSTRGTTSTYAGGAGI